MKKPLSAGILAKNFDSLCKQLDSPKQSFEKKASRLERLMECLAQLEEQASTGEIGPQKVKNEKAGNRKAVNEKCREIVGRAESGMTDAERELLKQYGARGGNASNTQWEYYAPPAIAEAMWGILRENGFSDGDVFNPCAGTGVFCGTKPTDGKVSVVGFEEDETAAKIAGILHPNDKVKNQELETELMDASFSLYGSNMDAAIGNIPFAPKKGTRYRDASGAWLKSLSVEKYYILRTIEKVRENGLICLMCPSSILNGTGPAWEEWRTRVAEQAEFLGAHKLPSETLKEQGSPAVVDILVWRKHPDLIVRGIAGRYYAEEVVERAGIYWRQWIEGGLYWREDGKKFIHGEYVPKNPLERLSREQVKGPKIDDAQTKSKLAVKFESHIDWELFKELGPKFIGEYSEGDVKVVNGKEYVHRYRRIDGAMRGVWLPTERDVKKETPIDRERYGVATLEELEKLMESPEGCLALTYQQAVNVLESYPSLIHVAAKDALVFAHQQGKGFDHFYRGCIIGSMIQGAKNVIAADEDLSAQLSQLRDLVTKEVEAYGIPANNSDMAKAAELSRPYSHFVQSVKPDGNFSDFLMGKTTENRPYDSKSVADVVRYLYAQKPEAVDIDAVLGLYDGDLKFSTYEEMAEVVRDVAYVPGGGVMPLGLYCSGKIFPKLDACREAEKTTVCPVLKARFKEQADIIDQRRAHADFDTADFSLQSSRWIPLKYFLEFFEQQEFYDVEYKELDENGEGIESSEPETEFSNDPNKGFSIGAVPWKLRYYKKQVTEYLQGKKVRRSSNEEKNSEVNAMLDALEEHFTEFIHQHKDAAKLKDLMERNYCGHLPQAYDNSPLDLSGILSGAIVPHSYQCEEVRRLSAEGKGICGFGTGLGKSFTALALAAYTYKKGIHKKTCIVVPKSVLENWYHEARTMYTEEYMLDRVIVVGRAPKIGSDGKIARVPVLNPDGTPKLLADGSPKMKDDLRITDEAEDLRRVAQSNVPLVVMSHNCFSSIPVSEKNVGEYIKDEAFFLQKGDVEKIEKVNQKLLSKNQIAKNAKPTFEELGIDSIITDEAHFFKNAFMSGKNTSSYVFMPVIDKSSISACGADMALKSSLIRKLNGGTGTYALTATPVSNSPLELYNMLSTFCGQDVFKEYNIFSPDQFVREFCKIEHIFAPTSKSGVMAEVSAVKSFKNFKLLSSIYRRYCNVKEYKDIDKEVKVPVQEEHREVVSLGKAEQREYEKLRVVASGTSGLGEVFKVMRRMDRLTTDYELYTGCMTFLFDLSLKEKFEKQEIRKEIEALKAPGLPDIDSNPPLEFKDNQIAVCIDAEKETDFLKLLKRMGIGQRAIRHKISAKYARMVANIKTHLAMHGKQIVFSEEKTQHHKIGRIILQEIPELKESEVGFINADDASGVQLDAISDAYNKGDIKIVVANKKAEVGVNLQMGTTAIHHMTLPWNPASIIQRNGRGVRQGNPADKVDVYYYLGKGTFDATRFSTVLGKYAWFSALRDGTQDTVDNDADGCLTEDDIDILLAADEEDARAKKEIQARRKTVTIERIARKRTATKIQRILISERELADLKEDTRTSVETIKASLNRFLDLCRTYLNTPFREDTFSEDNEIDFSKYEPYVKQMSAKDKVHFNTLVNRYKKATATAAKKRAEIEAFKNEAVKDLSEQVSNGTYAFKDTELFTDRTKLGKIAILKNAYIVEVGDYIEDDEYIYKVEEFEDRNRTSMIIQAIASKKYGCDKVGKEQLVECADFEAFPCVYSQDDFSFLKDINFSVRRYKDIASIPVDIYSRNKETISIFHKPKKRSRDKHSLCVLYYNGKYEIRYMQNTLTLKRVVHPSEVGDISRLVECIKPKSFSEDIDFEDSLLDLLSVLQIDERTAKKLVSDLKQKAIDQLLD